MFPKGKISINTLFKICGDPEAKRDARLGYLGVLRVHRVKTDSG